ncbi:serine-rich adhesin for platelets-like [Argopecten irradians]|uniref:serine-rich adhesin for platelets-like n=1 Tax=Argopecten irradians TaxID=31199 RepID=UPI003712B6BF
MICVHKTRMATSPSRLSSSSSVFWLGYSVPCSYHSSVCMGWPLAPKLDRKHIGLVSGRITLSGSTSPSRLSSSSSVFWLGYSVPCSNHSSVCMGWPLAPKLDRKHIGLVSGRITLSGSTSPSRLSSSSSVFWLGYSVPCSYHSSVCMGWPLAPKLDRKHIGLVSGRITLSGSTSPSRLSSSSSVFWLGYSVPCSYHSSVCMGWPLAPKLDRKHIGLVSGRITLSGSTSPSRLSSSSSVFWLGYSVPCSYHSSVCMGWPLAPKLDRKHIGLVSGRITLSGSTSPSRLSSSSSVFWLGYSVPCSYHSSVCMGWPLAPKLDRKHIGLVSGRITLSGSTSPSRLSSSSSVFWLGYSVPCSYHSSVCMGWPLAPKLDRKHIGLVSGRITLSGSTSPSRLSSSSSVFWPGYSVPCSYHSSVCMGWPLAPKLDRKHIGLVSGRITFLVTLRLSCP